MQIRSLALAVSLLACKDNAQPHAQRGVELPLMESMSQRAISDSHDTLGRPGDGESAGYGTAMALSEGAAGAPATARTQAIEQARAAGVLGSMAPQPAGAAIALNPSQNDHAANPWTDTASDRVSTFAADVDTASYTQGRRMLQAGYMPDRTTVRVEEWVNYFKYGFAPPASKSPFAVIMEAAPSPLTPGRHIVRVGVATKPKSTAERQPANLVFLVDVSGSMSSDDKLGLAKQSLGVLTGQLTEKDTVSIVTYAGDTTVVLEPTRVTAVGRTAILTAVDKLSSGGGTAMGSGIDLAYARAIKGVKPGYISRVIVLSDGDANIGEHTHDEMLGIISSRAKEGVTLSTVGFGTGNYNDTLMEQLADKGNGNNFYIDDFEQAKRVFREDIVANLEVVAKDVKFQVDFDPALVSRYRLVGYENRDIADHDFRNDKVDAGEVGAGHQVTALYEVELTAEAMRSRAPLGAVRTRHKLPTGTTATEAMVAMPAGPVATLAEASTDFRFAFAVAAFADVMREAPDAKDWSLATIRALAAEAAGDAADRKELVALIDVAIKLKGRQATR